MTNTHQYPTGPTVETRYMVDGKLHRTDGPAYILQSEDGSFRHEQWHENGRDVTEDRKNAFTDNTLIDW